MVSRWMLEAALVQQFTGNSFEEVYYPYDKGISDTRYTTVYYIPHLVTKLNDLQQELSAPNRDQNNYANNISLLRTELNKQLAVVGQHQLPEIKNFTVSLLDRESIDAAHNFLDNLKKYSRNKQATFIALKDSTTTALMHLDTFESLKQSNYNEYIARTVTNALSVQRVVEHNGQLVRLIDPIFMTNLTPSGPLDYRAPLYVPIKHFLGVTFTTFFFNILVVWVMTGFLILALFGNWLAKLVKRLSRPNQLLNKSS